jgi:hypothetical protein
VIRLLLGLYPDAWRERYGEELSALLEETGTGPRVALDTARGAVVAHLRDVPRAAPGARARLTVSGVLGAFIAFCFCVAAFAKTVEDLRPAGHGGALGALRDLALGTEVVALLAVAIAALPLAARAVCAALAPGGDRVRRLVLLPPAGLLISSALAAVLSAGWGHHAVGARPGPGAVAAIAVLLLCTLAAAVLCWLAPRRLLPLIAATPRELSISIRALGVVVFAMALATVAVGAYLVGMLTGHSRLAALPNGPGGHVSVGLSIAVELAAMAVLAAGAMLSARRGLTALGR